MCAHQGLWRDSRLRSSYHLCSSCFQQAFLVLARIRSVYQQIRRRHRECQTSGLIHSSGLGQRASSCLSLRPLCIGPLWSLHACFYQLSAGLQALFVWCFTCEADLLRYLIYFWLHNYFQIGTDLNLYHKPSLCLLARFWRINCLSRASQVQSSVTQIFVLLNQSTCYQPSW